MIPQHKTADRSVIAPEMPSHNLEQVPVVKLPEDEEAKEDPTELAVGGQRGRSDADDEVIG